MTVDCLGKTVSIMSSIVVLTVGQTTLLSRFSSTLSVSIRHSATHTMTSLPTHWRKPSRIQQTTSLVCCSKTAKQPQRQLSDYQPTGYGTAITRASRRIYLVIKLHTMDY